MIYAGIDVSKDTLHLALHEGGLEEFGNTDYGRTRLLEHLKEQGQAVGVVLEPTATYHLRIAELLARTEGMEVMVANPRATVNFAKAINQRGKSDKLDCQLLAQFGATVGFKAWTAPSPNVAKLRNLTRRRAQMVGTRTAEKNRLKEMKAVGADRWVIKDIEQFILQISKRIEKIEQVALGLVRTDKLLNHWRLMLKSMPGIGDVLAIVITAELVHLPKDITGRQLTAFAGMDPMVKQSGLQDGRRVISRRGNKRLRTALYLAAMTGCKNPHVRAWKDKQVARGKAPKLVNIAIARRYLHVIAHLRDTDTLWDGNSFHPLETAS